MTRANVAASAQGLPWKSTPTRPGRKPWTWRVVSAVSGRVVVLGRLLISASPGSVRSRATSIHPVVKD